MARKLLLDRSYTFSNYFEMGIIPRELAQEFGYNFQKLHLCLPAYAVDIDRLELLRQRIQDILPYLELENETARREFMIAPIISELIYYTKARLRVEYSLKLNDQLQGIIDYHIEAEQAVVIIEAKQADLSRGFSQLTAELIALDQWLENQQPQILGAVTTGNIWQFGILDRPQKLIQQDLNLYRVPADLDQVFPILLHFLLPSKTL
ncbi:MAG: hypothetical protein RMK91_05560 [Pseudanabaenaceae cyanobacterium SKYGB_i_bin29]|nr:hypothetical protein [Pseudanabaenaceae cyanobacterium SKYG29]MDW8421316.1 hypothetical protein [Pseudanabaenaceae cyanobacterium SKYGB_i_bin29]